MTHKQKEIFIAKEGDQWFKRNNAVDSNNNKFKDVDTFVSMIKDKDKILEIGTSDGMMLATQNNDEIIILQPEKDVMPGSKVS